MEAPGFEPGSVSTSTMESFTGLVDYLTSTNFFAFLFFFSDLMLSQATLRYEPDFAEQLTALLGFLCGLSLSLRVTDLLSMVLLTLFPGVQLCLKPGSCRRELKLPTATQLLPLPK